MLDDSHHGFEEFFVADRAILILVNLSHDLSPDLTVLIIRKHLATLEDSLELLNSDLAISAGVQEAIQLLNVSLIDIIFTLLQRGDKLFESDHAVFVQVSIVENLLPVLRVDLNLAVQLDESLDKLFLIEEAVAGHIKAPKQVRIHRHQFFTCLHPRQVLNQHSLPDHCLSMFITIAFGNRLKVFLNMQTLSIQLLLEIVSKVVKPLMIQHLLHGRSKSRILRQALVNEIFGVR